MRVIIADEHVVNRKKIRQIIESMAYEVIAEAQNGLHTYHKYVECVPDLLVLNLNMPLYDGLSTLERIMKFDHQARIVVMAHEQQNQLLFEAMEKGAIHYLKLPIVETDIKKVFYEIEILKRRRSNV